MCRALLYLGQPVLLDTLLFQPEFDRNLKNLADIAQMKPLLAQHMKSEFLAQIRGSTDSEWIYALFAEVRRGRPHIAVRLLD